MTARRYRCTKPFSKSFRISSRFGATDSELRTEPHKGVDFACPKGTPLIACFDGLILIQRDGSDNSRAGSRLWLYNYADDIRAGYFHMSEFKFDKAGENVKRGELIGWSGDTGNVSGPHLHFQLEGLKDGLPCEPIFIDGE